MLMPRQNQVMLMPRQNQVMLMPRQNQVMLRQKILSQLRTLKKANSECRS
jgi:hypothetical protein